VGNAHPTIYDLLTRSSNGAIQTRSRSVGLPSRFFKFYIKSLYRSKGDTIKNVQIHNDEDLEIDLMFIGDLAKQGWKEQDFGLFDRRRRRASFD
jgi:hypothetical protein